jgi:hypothetical protein
MEVLWLPTARKRFPVNGSEGFEWPGRKHGGSVAFTRKVSDPF